MKAYKIKGFTLVELVITITILAILSTIAFIGFQGNSKSARDSSRLLDLKNINNGLQLYSINSNKYPKPDDYITISLSGAELSYQGNIGETVGRILKFNSIPKDSLTSENYYYSTDVNGKGYTIMGYLEEENNLLSFVSKTYASNLNKNNPKILGNGVGILTDSSNEVIKENTDLFSGSHLNNQYKILFGNGKQISGSGLEIGGIYETLAKNGHKGYGQPGICPEGFIAVPGNEELGQPGFCVAKYEMTYKNLTGNPSNSLWNTYGSGTDNPPCTKFRTPANSGENCTKEDFKNQNGGIVSQSGYPLTNLTQHEAIQACKSMGEGFHLITNNEWVTLARNIESNSLNWSGGIIGTNLFNGISHYPNFGCTGTEGGKFGVSSKDTSCTRRIHKLTNGEEIWDLAGNVWEHVNKANTINGEGYNLGLTKIDLEAGNWSSIYQLHNVGWSGTGITDDDRKKYSSKNSIYNHTTNGIGNIYGWELLNNNNIFLRGGSAPTGINTGIFTIYLAWNMATHSQTAGFRCAY